MRIMTNLFCLNPSYATTRLVIRDKPVLDDPPEAKFQSLLFLPPNFERKGEGGLRTKGYFKQSLRDKPLITVITVVFNGVTSLENAINSVINQKYDNVEFIVLDGESIDGTLDIIKKYEDQIDYWVSEKDGGIYDAMNKAVTVSRGDWILFLGADDILTNCFHSIIYKMVDYSALYYGNVLLASNQSVYCGRINKYKLMQQNICHQSIFYPQNTFKSRSYNCRYRFLADYCLNIELLGSGVKFNYLDEIICIFNDTGVSADGDADLMEDLLRIILNSFGPFYYFLKKLRNLIVMVIKK